VVKELSATGVSVWLDRSGIGAGRRWPEEIARAISDCEVLVLACSRSSVASEYVLSEVTLAYEKRKPILALEVEPTDVAPALQLQLAGKQRLSLVARDRDAAIGSLVAALADMGVMPANGVAARAPAARPPLPEAPRPPAPPVGNLPAAMGSFVGRERETQALADALQRDDSRLVVLTGPGGVGKTRLALRCAGEAAPGCPDGAWFVDLTSSRTAAEAESAAILALGVSVDHGGSPRDALRNHLRGRRVLLVLDNCEQVIEACAALVGEVVAHCPGVRVLATSREALGVPGEITLPVAPLPVPARNAQTDPAALAELDSVRLFVERARAANPAFALSHGNAPAVAEICARLDGIPLALELAAARTRGMSVEQIAERLDRKLALLSAGPRGAQPRQRTLGALMDWSFELLAPEEQELFARLAVFRGGFTLEAVQVVAFDEPAEDWEALDLLLALVGKSLVMPSDASGGTMRYGMLETMNDYAAAKLAEARSSAEVALRHFVFFRALVGDAGQADPSKLALELPNIRAALEWTQGARPQEGLEFACGLREFWLAQCAWREGCDVIEAMLGAALSAPPELVSRAQAVAGGLAVVTGDLDRAAAMLSTAEAALRSGGNAAHLSMVLYWRAVIARERGLFDDAEQLLEEARSTGGPTAMIANELASVALYKGDLAAARERCCEALSLVQDPRREDVYLTARSALAAIDLFEGRVAEARSGYESLLSLAVELGNRRLEAEARARIGDVCARQGAHEEALALYAQAVHTQRELCAMADLAGTLHSAGEVRRALGHAAAAWRDYAECLAINLDQANFRGARYALAGLAAILSEREDHRDALCLLGAMGAPSLGGDGAASVPHEFRDPGGVATRAAETLGDEVCRRHRAVGEVMTAEQIAVLVESLTPCPPDGGSAAP